MRTAHILILCLFSCLVSVHSLHAQNTCGPEPAIDTSKLEGTVYFNFGSSARSKSNSYKTAFAVGQNFVGQTDNLNRSSSLGFYGRYFLPPFELKVKATQGELLDRIQVTWEIDALGPSPNDGFNIYRDGIFLQKVEAKIRSFNDFNVIAGRPYTYCVRGINIFGEGVESCALGFQVPNGTVTGWVSTLNGTAVPGASVTLTPMQGFSLKFNDGDGAFALEDTLNPFLPSTGEDWTIMFWIKTDTAGNLPGKLIGMPGLYIRSRPNNGNTNGITVSTTPGGAFFLAGNFTSNPDSWHHVTLTYDGISNKGRLYFDGKLTDIAAMNSVPSPDTLKLGELAGPGLWVGRLDELRIYHHRLDELDFDQVMEGTASSETPFLTHYWKMDEELGVKSYDIVRRQQLYFCGPEDNVWFNPDRPPVHTAGITNEDGYYKIESASYGTGTTFLAKPKKNFYMHRSLKFEKVDSAFATLPNFSLTNKATIETWINSAGVDGSQCVLSKQWSGNEFRLILLVSGTDYQIRVNMNNVTHDFGILGSGYQHLAMTWDSLDKEMVVYKNGTPLGSFVFSTVSGNWSETGKPWYLGKRFDGSQPYGGLIDEFAVYDTILSDSIIHDHFVNARNMQEPGLRVYFPLDEGAGNKLSNVGSVLLTGGTTSGTEWSPLAVHQVIEPHVFTPATRQVTLNPSVTSVDQVDFTDRSTIPVTGYVRYSGTDCFAVNVEILVNGESFNPQVFTDSTGKFVIDFDPGASAILTPVIEDHVFVPANWEVTNVSSPIAGLLFNDITVRKITGRVTGGTVDGLCKKSIIVNPGTPQGTVCKVKVRSVDGCFEREIQVLNVAGNFTFNNLPPLDKMTVAVSEFSDIEIYNAFQAKGAPTVDISKKDTMGLTFLYTAQPQVEVVDGLDPYSPTCDLIVFDQFDSVTFKIKLKEVYDGGVCHIDTATFRIINGFGDETVDTIMSNGLLTYGFRVGTPNPTPPYLKTLQIIGTTIDSNDCEFTQQGLVTGLRAKDETFLSTMPEIPTLILRDPPGDGSYSFLEKNQKFCQATEIINEVETGLGGGIMAYLGGEIQIVNAPLGVGTINNAGLIFDIGANAQISYERIASNTFETCVSVDSRISTSDGQLIVGGFQGGDVYMGAAQNIIFGFADLVSFNEALCAPARTTVLNVEPGDATTFMYSEWYIKNTVLVNLDSLIINPETDPADLPGYIDSKNRWLAILENNKEQKENAKFLQNISFDAGTEFEYSETSDTTSAESISNLGHVDWTTETHIGYEFNSGGIVGTINTFSNTTNGGRDEYGTAKGIKTGYVLKDDDPLDAFSIDVGMDTVYKTPVFNIKAGQSSCPWEYGTAKRQGMLLTSVDGPVRTDVPANEPAVFHFIMGNISATNETFTYAFTAGPESNPDGAEIFCNGAPMNQIQWYAIPYGTSLPVTVTVERGPVEYDYDSLEIVLYSACEDLRANELGILPDTLTNLYSAVYVSAHFIRPCSEVNINVPQQDWVVFNDTVPNEIVRITISGYDTIPSQFKLIRMQYRLSDGDGTWINIPGVNEIYNPTWQYYDTLVPPPPVLQHNFTNFFWDTEGLSDGPYEIRAVAECSGDVANRPGFSEVIKGRIDREPPKLIGVPEPSDGVLQVGDEISFTFNKPLDCNQLWAGTVIDHVNLYNTRTNQLMNTNVTCVGNKIVIEPTDQNMFFENDILRVDLDSIADMAGNTLIHTDWEFYVDRNELAWLTDSIGITKYEDETKSITVKIYNRGGYPVPFTIDSIPYGVHVTPDAGTLVANEIREIEITAADTIDLGWFKDSIVLHTDTGVNPFFMGGDEALPFDVRNICRPPNWEVDPSLYQQTMTFCLKININGDLSDDAEDQIGAFIDGQIRGSAKLTHITTPFNSWVAFLTVYGNAGDANKPVIFEIFDASACLHYPALYTAGDTSKFTSNGTVGSPNGPRTLVNNSYVIHELPVNTGWNWLTFNLDFPDPAINEVLNNIPNPTGDLVKDQNTFSLNINQTWSGSLADIGHSTMYMYQATNPNTIKITGNPLDPTLNPITVHTNWNWLPYIPTYRLPVNTALASLNATATAGDVIKSQSQFAQLVNVSGNKKWVGNLTHLDAPNGYLLRSAAAGTLTYPNQSITDGNIPQSRDEESITSYWTVDPSQYEFNMTLIGIFQYEGVNATTPEMELGAFVGDEIRGVGTVVYIEFLDAYMFFATCLSNTNGEQLHFKLYDAVTGDIQNLREKVSFSPNAFIGSIDAPVPFSLQATGIHDEVDQQFFEVQPNPFSDATVCRFDLTSAQDIQLQISDMNGQVIEFRQMHANQGLNTITWNGRTHEGNPLSNGIYFMRLKTDDGISTRKVVLAR